MKDITFVECGDGDPAHRFENAKLGMALFREFGDSLLSQRFFEIKDLDDKFVFGPLTLYGMTRDTSRTIGRLDPFIWANPGVRALAGRDYEVLRGAEAIRYAEELHDAGKGLHIVDALSPEHRYRVLGQMRKRENCGEEVRHVLGSRHEVADCAILDGKSSGAEAERRFIFVDGALVTETPASFDINTMSDDAEEIRSDRLQLRNHRLIRDGDPGITRDQRELALSIAGAVEGFTGALDIAMAGSALILSAAHQAHAGDYNLYGADIPALASASAVHARRLIAEYQSLHELEEPEF